MFRAYAILYEVEIIEIKDPDSSIKDLFSDLLNETKGFKYHITVEVLFKKYKLNGEIEFAPVHFNSVTKTVINHRFRLENAFQEILYLIDAWINKASDWFVESIKSQYINISTYRSLSRRSYINLPVELRYSKQGLINIKSKDQKCFLWCHVRHINLSKQHPERIRKVDKNLLRILVIQRNLCKKIKSLLEILVMMELSFQCKKKDFSKIEVKNNICINVFGYENELFFTIYV